MACFWDKMLMRKQLQREFEIYQRLPSHHPHLIRMFGFSSSSSYDDDEEGGELILEYMPNGKSQSRSHPMLRWIRNVARGGA